MRRLTLLIAVAALSTACLGSDFADSVEGSWQLTSGIVEGEDIPILANHPITFTLEGNQVSGIASCNSYGGTYRLSGSDITFGDLAMTEMACFPPETMDAEALYGQALTLVTSVSTEEGLILEGPGARLVFTPLEPVPDAELTNTVWVLDGLVRGDSVSSVSGDRATLEFFTDGSVLGATGCRLLSGHYRVDGTELAITDLGPEGQDCDPDLADQDEQVLSVLQGTAQIEITEDRLTITGDGGAGLMYLAEQQSGVVPLHLWVSNQSFDIDPVDIVLSIDGGTVVDQKFTVGDQHNWVPFDVALEPGMHLLRAVGNSGKAVSRKLIDISTERWVVVDFWLSGVDEVNQFAISVQDGPVGNM